MKKLIVILALIYSHNALAQNNVSPYSIVGLGDFEKSYFDKTSGLGHNGVALTSDKFVLISNPASLSFLAPSFYQNRFYVDLATRYKSSTYTGSSISNATENTADDIQFKKLSFSIKVKPKWGLSFGLLPYTSSNYSFTTVKNIIGSSSNMDASYAGKGSSNVVYISNSYLVNKKLSVGLQSSLFFGNFSGKETIYNSIADSGLVSEENVFISKVMFKAGVIYKDTINKNWNYSIGATGSLKTSVNANHQTSVKDGRTTLHSTQEQVLDYLQLPAMFTIGFAVNFKKDFTLVADYTHHDWNNVKNTKGFNYNITNYNKYGAGLEYHLPNNDATKRRGDNFFQVGYYITNGYLNVIGQNINDNAVTFGFTKQFRDERLALQLTAEIGSRGKTDYGLIKERFTQIGLTVCYKDFWNTRKIKRYN